MWDHLEVLKAEYSQKTSAPPPPPSLLSYIPNLSPPPPQNKFLDGILCIYIIIY